MPTKRASVLRIRDWQGETAQQQPSTPISSSTSPAQHLMLGGGGVAEEGGEEGLAHMMAEGALPPPAYQMPHEEYTTDEGEKGETQPWTEEGTTAVSMLAESSDEEDGGYRQQQEDEPPVEGEEYSSVGDYAEGQHVNPPHDGEESREDSRDSHQVWRDAHLNRNSRGVHDQPKAPHNYHAGGHRHDEHRSLGHKSQRAGDAEGGYSSSHRTSIATSHQTQRPPHQQQQRPNYPPPSFEDSVNRTQPHATTSRNQPQRQQHHEAQSHTAPPPPQYTAMANAHQPSRPAPMPSPHPSLPSPAGEVVPVHPGMQYVPGYPFPQPAPHQLPPGVGPGYPGQPVPPPMPMPPMHGNYPVPYGQPFVPPQGSSYGPPPMPPQAYTMGPVPLPAHHSPSYAPIPMQGGMPPSAQGYGAHLPPPPMRPAAGGAPAPSDAFRQKAMSLREFIPTDERIKCLHIAPPPDKVVSAVSGGGERDNHGKRPFPTNEAIRAFFGSNVLSVEILSGNHPTNPSYAFIEFDTREHAVQSFLQLGLFVKITDVPLKLGWSKTYREPIIRTKQQQEQPMLNLAQMSRLSPQEQLLAEQYAQFLQQEKARGGANPSTTNAYPPGRDAPPNHPHPHPHHQPHHINRPPPHHPAAFEQRGQGRDDRHAPPMPHAVSHNHQNNNNFRGYPPPPQQSLPSQPAPYAPYPPYAGHADVSRIDGDVRPPHRGPRTEAQHPTPHQHQYHTQQHQQQPQYGHSQHQPQHQHQSQGVGRHPHLHPHHQPQQHQHGGPHHAPTYRGGEDADRRPPPPSYAEDVRRPPSRF